MQLTDEAHEEDDTYTPPHKTRRAFLLPGDQHVIPLPQMAIFQQIKQCFGVYSEVTAIVKLFS